VVKDGPVVIVDGLDVDAVAETDWRLESEVNDGSVGVRADPPLILEDEPLVDVEFGNVSKNPEPENSPHPWKL
jgi:hypothetical protein